MAATNHLTWTEVKDFGGLWTAGASHLMPADKAQVMSGCHPQVGGGLRAFLKVVETVPGNGFLMSQLNLPGLGSATASTPNMGAGEISGATLDIRAHVALADWTPTGLSAVVSNRPSAVTFNGYELFVQTTGTLILIWGNGAAEVQAESTVGTGIANGSAKWIRAVLVGNNGAGGKSAFFYTSDDGVAWTQLGATVTTGGTTTIAAATNAMHIGARPGGTLPLGATTVYRVEVWPNNADEGNALQGVPPTVSADFTNQLVGAGTFVDDHGRTWTINGTAAIAAQPSAELSVPIGFNVVATSQGGPSAPRFHLVSLKPTARTVWQVHTYPVTGLSKWTSVKGYFANKNSTSAAPEPSQPSFAQLGVANFSRVYLGLSIRESPTPGSGVFRLDPNQWSGKQLTTAFNNAFGASALVEHQARLVGGYQDTLKFSAPGDENFAIAGSGFVRLNPAGIYSEDTTDFYEGVFIAWMVSVPPGDLIVATRDGRIYNVQGNLGDPTVRELGRWTTMIPHQPAATPKGIYFILPNQGVTRLGTDGSAGLVSKDLLPAIWQDSSPGVSLGQLAGTERYVFVPNRHTTTAHKNGALVYDTETNAWFTSTHADDFTITNPTLMQADLNTQDSGIWVVSGATLNNSASPLLFHFRTGAVRSVAAPGLYASESRASTWEYKSAPLREPSGRHLVIREVRIPAFAFNNNVSTLAVTVNGVTITKTLPAGSSTQVFMFRQQAKSLDVNIKSKSNDTAIEAPLVEGYRVGWRSGPMI